MGAPRILGAGDGRDQSRPSLDGMGVGRRLRRRPFSPASCLRATAARTYIGVWFAVEDGPQLWTI